DLARVGEELRRRDGHLLRLDDARLDDAVSAVERALSRLQGRDEPGARRRGRAVEIARGRGEVADHLIVIEMEGHLVVTAEVALDAGARAKPLDIARGDER